MFHDSFGTLKEGSELDSGTGIDLQAELLGDGSCRTGSGRMRWAAEDATASTPSTFPANLTAIAVLDAEPCGLCVVPKRKAEVHPQ